MTGASCTWLAGHVLSFLSWLVYANRLGAPRHPSNHQLSPLRLISSTTEIVCKYSQNTIANWEQSLITCSSAKLSLEAVEYLWNDAVSRHKYRMPASSKWSTSLCFAPVYSLNVSIWMIDSYLEPLYGFGLTIRFQIKPSQCHRRKRGI